MVGRTGENFGVEKRWKKNKNPGREMGFSFIRKTASTGSSATGALVAANSLQPSCWIHANLWYVKESPPVLSMSFWIIKLNSKFSCSFLATPPIKL